MGPPRARTSGSRTETASATIEVRRLCDDVVVDSRTLSIPPNTIVQTNGLGSGDSATSCFIAQAVMRYTVVTVSQPSLVYVANLSNSVKPAIPGATPIVGLAVAQQSKF